MNRITTVIRNKVFIVSAIIVVIVLASAWWFMASQKIPAGHAQINLGKSVIIAEVADAEAEWTQGLSGRTGLATSTGMLFVFDKADRWGIWMKDMKFAIDILWLDKDYKIVGVRPQVSPASYPTVFEPGVDALYVLEVPVGTVARSGIRLGDAVTIKK